MDDEPINLGDWVIQPQTGFRGRVQERRENLDGRVWFSVRSCEYTPGIYIQVDFLDASALKLVSPATRNGNGPEECCTTAAEPEEKEEE